MLYITQFNTKQKNVIQLFQTKNVILKLTFLTKPHSKHNQKNSISKHSRRENFIQIHIFIQIYSNIVKQIELKEDIKERKRCSGV